VSCDRRINDFTISLTRDVLPSVKKVIHPGEEIFMDYGEEYFTTGKKGGSPGGHQGL